jgi:hypothetical protein
MGWLAADVEADVADGLVACERGWLAAVLYADVADGLVACEQGWLADRGF